MRAFSMPPGSIYPGPPPVSAPQRAQPLSFLPFCADAFAQARSRHVPVFLVIAREKLITDDPSLNLLLTERTVPVHLLPGERPDVELICQRASVLFSGEGALPLCALMTDSALAFLAAPLPPAGFPLDPARLYTWLSQADRRFSQNHAACSTQAAHVIRSFGAERLTKPYSPSDAAHDLSRALLKTEDSRHGGFGGVKSPFVCALRFSQHAAESGNKPLHRALSRTLDAMLSSSLYDPLDGSFFSTTLTDDWQVFVPEKPLGSNAMLADVFLRSGRRSEAIRMLDALVSFFALPGGGLSAALLAPRSTYAFTPKQACAALGGEDGLRACRLLSLLRKDSDDEPSVQPSRFSPVYERGNHGFESDAAPRFPKLPASLTPEDSAFLRRVMPMLLRARSARTPQTPLPHVISEHCALAASVLAACGHRLGETRYIQAAQRAVSYLIAQPPMVCDALPLPASVYPGSALHAQAVCGASSALALAQLTLSKISGMEEYAQSGLRLLSAALHTFIRPDGLVMHTPQNTGAFFPRVPAIFDSELPSPAAQLVLALRLAHTLRPEAHYDEAIEAIWQAATPAVKAQPLACAGLIDAMTAD